ncbi:TonB-dependent siderophore receptor [Stutzerimonas kirkiae]|uniref:TonB-dependent siderophore receptor n=1 Tax=Stutzerimonas kirkiae TaxID=2211392 RepID=UPI001038587B|nr:TonB-dependent receptor [Stutzerimonas kirkiae]TBV09724.1 TonB-dependent siderophore receptor [Stutzerimonas kirkiae]
MPTQHSLNHMTKALRLRQAFKSRLPAVALAATLPLAVQAQTQEWQLNIPAQPLNQALQELASKTGVQLLYNPGDVEGLRSTALNGRYQLADSIRTIIQGTGLSYGLSGNTVTLQAVSKDSLEISATDITSERLGATTEGTSSYTTGSTSAATRLNLSIRETPQSISVITRQRMDDQGLTNTVQALEQMAGIVINHDDGERYNIISRGGEINQFQIDGVPTSTLSVNQLSPLTQADMAIYDRIEVVRGAAGLMTGAGVPGGVVSLVRKKPTKQFQASIQGSAGRWDNYRGESDISGPLTDDGKIRGRFVAAKQDNKSFTDYYGQEKDILFGVLETDLTDSTLLRFGVDYQNLQWNGTSGVPLFYSDGTQTNLSRSTSRSTPWRYTEQETYNYTLDIEQNLAHDWQFNMAANYMDAKNHSYFGGLVAYLYQSINKETNQASLVSTGGLSKWQTQKGVALNLQGPFNLFDRQHEAIIGFNYSGYENTYENYGETMYPNYDFGRLADLVPATKNPATGHSFHSVHQRGYYTALRLNPADRWHVILGARASDYSYDTHSLIFATNTKSNITKSQKNGEVTPYAGIVYDLALHQSIYASYTDIFTPNNVVDANMKALEPQVGSNYELGWKGEFYDGRLNANIALYQVKRDNVAEYIGEVQGISIYQAINGVKTEGIDVELAGEILPGWNLSASYSHSRSENQEGERQFTYLPVDTVKLFTTYQLPGAYDKLTIGGGMNWNAKMSAYNQYIDGTARQDDHFVFNAMARYRVNEHLSAVLNINNLFDKEYYQSINTYAFAYYGEPRNAKLTVRYDF